MTESGPGRLGRRLRRILLLLPYAIRHPGVGVDELSRKFGVKKADLLDDLQLVFLCGLPGYGPGDLIDVTIEDDRVYVRMADYFSSPLRLTPAEAIALYAGASALADLPGMEEADALRRATAKLGRALGARDPKGESRTVRVQVEAGPQEHLATLEEALAAGKKVKLEYYSASRGALTERTVAPWGLIAALGRGYLVGWDDLAEDERMFRTDRIKSAEILEEDASVPDDFDPGRYRGAWVQREDEPTIRMEVSPRAAGWFEDYYPVVSAETTPDGWRAVELVSSGDSWAATLALRLGSDARAIEPESVVKEARDLAGRIAERY